MGAAPASLGTGPHHSGKYRQGHAWHDALKSGRSPAEDAQGIALGFTCRMLAPRRDKPQEVDLHCLALPRALLALICVLLPARPPLFFLACAAFERCSLNFSRIARLLVGTGKSYPVR